MKLSAEKMRNIISETIAELSAAQVDGSGPAILGVAAVNEPHLSHLREIEVFVEDGKELLRVHIARFGKFFHPQAPKKTLVFDTPFFNKLIANFRENVIGRKVFLDKNHEPNAGSLGELIKLDLVSDGLEGIFDPTPMGLQAIKDRVYRYASIYFSMKWKGTQVGMAFSHPAREADMLEILEEVVVKMSGTDPTGNQVDPAPPQGQPAPTITAPIAPTDDRGNVRLSAVESELAALRVELSAEKAALQTERAAFAEEQRKARVRLWVDKLSAPDENGMCYDSAFLSKVRAVLSEEPGEGEGGIKLSADSTVHDFRAYYVKSIQDIVELAPRVVPTQSKISGGDKRPGDGEDPATIALKAARDEHRGALIAARRAITGQITLTAEQLKEIEDDVNTRYPEVK